MADLKKNIERLSQNPHDPANPDDPVNDVRLNVESLTMDFHTSAMVSAEIDHVLLAEVAELMQRAADSLSANINPAIAAAVRKHREDILTINLSMQDL